MRRKTIFISIAGAIIIIAFSIKYYFIQKAKPSHREVSQSFENYLQEASQLFKKKEYRHALSYCAKAIKENPHSAPAYYNCGLTLEKIGAENAALDMYKQALQINPHYKNAYLRMTDLLRKQKKFKQALAIIDAYLAKNPVDREALLLKASTLNYQGELEASLALCTELIQKNPAYDQAYIMLGTTYEKLNRFSDSFAAFQKAVALNPRNPKAHTALANSCLALGNYSRWAQEHEWRWQTGTFKNRPTTPLWDGSSLHNKKILVRTENGLGDMIQYVRFTPKLKERGAHVIAVVQKPLKKLFSTLPFIDEVITTRDPEPTADFMTGFMSLPYYFPITEQTVGKTPYIKADLRLEQEWKKKLSSDKKFKVGICWHASPIDQQYSIPQSRRTMALETIAKLATVPGISLYSLQKDWPAKELERYNIKNFGPHFDREQGAFIDTAAVMKNLDLVITIDTVTAHLAGALDVPVWVMLPLAADVRWMLDRTDTPWYKSMQFFRQTKREDWDSVIANVSRAAEKRIATFNQAKK